MAVNSKSVNFTIESLIRIKGRFVVVTERSSAGMVKMWSGVHIHAAELFTRTMTNLKKEKSFKMAVMLSISVYFQQRHEYSGATKTHLLLRWVNKTTYPSAPPPAPLSTVAHESKSLPTPDLVHSFFWPRVV